MHSFGISFVPARKVHVGLQVISGSKFELPIDEGDI